jgi:hypothetical protein
MYTRARNIFVIGAAALVAAGCGGGGDSKATAKERIDGCLKKQPDATKADCEGWEKDGQLDDDGTHQGHKG